ncbi:hypothetical protein Tco_1475339 [Tanacetum coccineum]
MFSVITLFSSLSDEGSQVLEKIESAARFSAPFLSRMITSNFMEQKDPRITLALSSFLAKNTLITECPVYDKALRQNMIHRNFLKSNTTANCQEIFFLEEVVSGSLLRIASREVMSPSVFIISWIIPGEVGSPTKARKSRLLRKEKVTCPRMELRLEKK